MSIDRDNFKKALDRYQGKESNRIPEIVFDSLDQYFLDHNILTRDRAETAALDKSGKRIGTSREMIYIALKDKGFTVYYEHANEIAAKYWKWQLPQLTKEQEKEILDSYNKTK